MIPYAHEHLYEDAMDSVVMHIYVIFVFLVFYRFFLQFGFILSNLQKPL